MYYENGYARVKGHWVKAENINVFIDTMPAITGLDFKVNSMDLAYGSAIIDVDIARKLLLLNDHEGVFNGYGVLVQIEDAAADQDEAREIEQEQIEYFRREF